MPFRANFQLADYTFRTLAFVSHNPASHSYPPWLRGLLHSAVSEYATVAYENEHTFTVAITLSSCPTGD